MKLTAIVSLIVGVVLLVLGAYANVLHLIGIPVMWATSASFIVANFSLTAVFWTNQGKSHFLWDDVASCASMMMMTGIMLGLLLMFLQLLYPMNLAMLPGLKYATIGMIVLGLLCLSVFFAGIGLNAMQRKDFWPTLQGFFVGGAMFSLAGSCSVGLELFALPQVVAEICLMAFFIFMGLALFSIFIPSIKEKMAAKRFRHA